MRTLTARTDLLFAALVMISLVAGFLYLGIELVARRVWWRARLSLAIETIPGIDLSVPITRNVVAKLRTVANIAYDPERAKCLPCSPSNTRTRNRSCETRRRRW